MRVKCLAQEHNTATWPGFKPGPFDLEASVQTIRPPCLPLGMPVFQYFCPCLICFCQQDTYFISCIFPLQSAMNSVVMRAVEEAGLPFDPAKVE